MKSMVSRVAWLGLLFVAGFVAARMLSRPEDLAKQSETDSAANARVSGSAVRRAGYGRRKSGLASAIRAQERVDAALDRGDFQGILEASGYGEWASTVAFAWAAADPEGLWRWLEDGGRSRIGVWGIYAAVFKNWFKQDPDAALDALRKTGRYDRADGKRAILELLFGDDPEVTRAVGEHLDEFIGEFEVDRKHSVGKLLSGGLEMVDKMRGLPESHAKANLLHYAVAGWFGSDWMAARDWAAALSGAERVEMEHALFKMGVPPTIERDPDAMGWVAEWLGHEENRDLRVKLGSQVVSVMARKDPEAAMEWATANLGGASLGDAIGTVVARQLSKNRAAAFGMVDGLPPGGLRLQAGRRLIIALQGTDPSAAYERALGDLEAGFGIGSQDWQQLGIALSRKPDDAMRILSSLPENVPAIFEERTIEYLGCWHPEKTLEWATELEGERGLAIRELVLRSWRARDPAAVEKWESGLRSGQ